MGKDLVEKIAKENNSTHEDFIKAVNKGPEWVQDSTGKIHRKAFETFQNWRCRSELKYPPYIAYLALFVLPYSLKLEDSQSSSYYTRLNEIIGSEKKSPYSDIEKTLNLWEDLEKWSLEDKKSEFGEFQVDIYGKHFYVGIPLYQVVLTADDKTELPRIFQKKGWDSDSNPTEAEIITVLKEFKRDFSSKTSKRIEEGKDDFLSKLAKRVFVELKEYDEETIDEEESQKSNKHGFIDLCLDEINILNKKAIFSFRCRRKEGLPDEDFKLTNNVSKWQVSIHHFFISRKIENFDIDWEKNFSTNFELSSLAEKYNFSYRGERYKIFTSAEKFAIPGWISGQRYTPEKQFYLAVHTSLSDKVHKWGEEECDRCKKLDFTGLPENWDLFEVGGVKGESLIKDTIPSLSIDKTPRIQFDGIRHSKGNKFFDFVPPTVSIIGGMKQISTLYCLVGNREAEEAEPLIPLSEDKRVFFLPKTIPVGEYVKISNNEDQIKASFIFVKSELKQFSNYSEDLKMNNFGILNSNRTTSGEPAVPAECSLQGAYGYGLKAIKNHPRLLPPFLLAGAKKKRRKVYLVGNTPGEIITWPDDPFPVSWFPVWLIQQQSRKKFTIHSCWNKENSFLQNAQQVFTKDKIRLWKQVIWHNRKWIKAKKRQQRKWELFLEKVKNV